MSRKSLRGMLVVAACLLSFKGAGMAQMSMQQSGSSYGGSEATSGKSRQDAAAAASRPGLAQVAGGFCSVEIGSRISLEPSHSRRSGLRRNLSH